MWKFFLNGIEQINKAISATVTNELDRQNSTFQVNCKDIFETFHFLESNITIEGEDIASGIVTGQKFKDAGYLQTAFTCTDHNYILQHRIVVERYENMTVDAILRHMLTKYAPEFGVSHIDNTLVEVESFPCDYTLLSEAIPKLMDYLTDYHYYIDADREFHLFSQYEEDGVRFDHNNFLPKTFDLDFDAEDVVNRVWIIGAKQAAENPITQYFTCDGQQRYYTLAYEPNYASVYLDGVLMNSLVNSNDDGNQDFLIDKTNKTIYIPVNIETPFTGVLSVVYQPTIQFIDYFHTEDADNPYLLEKVIKNKNVTNKMSARAYGRAEIKRVRSIKQVIRFRTFDVVKIGQRHYVKEDTFGVEGYFLTTKVNMIFGTDGKVLFNPTMEAIS